MDTNELRTALEQIGAKSSEAIADPSNRAVAPALLAAHRSQVETLLRSQGEEAVFAAFDGITDKAIRSCVMSSLVLAGADFRNLRSRTLLDTAAVTQ